MPACVRSPWRLMVRCFEFRGKAYFENRLRGTDTRSVRRDSGLVLVGDTEVGQKKTGFQELGRICNDKS